MRSAPRQSRGCAVAAISVLAAAALLMVVGGVWAIVSLTVGAGAYEAAPGCEVGETEALDARVPERRTEIEQPVEGLDPTWRDGHECRWGTAEDSTEVPAAARLVLIRNGDHGGTDGEQQASDALAAASRERAPEPINDLGDEAYAWNESSQGFAWGCVGVRLSNLYTLTCYTASIDYHVSGAIPEDESLAAAEEIARATVARIEEGDY
ncbi:hypothetical protein [Nocardiopsis trehalosi]|uniref:hypothetical protein n=1 Tax=Nocardiopsis trehalosi TaxID=109329 RepID=UPI0009FE2B5D|nr:hypothetical protein [Nocardiopsis trehalosi]